MTIAASLLDEAPLPAGDMLAQVISLDAIRQRRLRPVLDERQELLGLRTDLETARERLDRARYRVVEHLDAVTSRLGSLDASC